MGRSNESAYIGWRGRIAAIIAVTHQLSTDMGFYFSRRCFLEMSGLVHRDWVSISSRTYFVLYCHDFFHMGLGWTAVIPRELQAVSSVFVFFWFPYQPYQYSRSRFLHYCVYNLLVHTCLEIRLVRTGGPSFLCKLAVSGRRSGSFPPSFWGSVMCHGSIHGCHIMWSLGWQGQMCILLSTVVKPCR